MLVFQTIRHKATSVSMWGKIENLVKLGCKEESKVELFLRLFHGSYSLVCRFTRRLVLNLNMLVKFRSLHSGVSLFIVFFPPTFSFSHLRYYFVNLLPLFQGDADFRRILANVDPPGSGFVTYDSFMRFMTQQASGSESAEQLIDSFRILANEQVSLFPNDLQQSIPVGPSV